ncbi:MULTISPECIES: D-glycero-beta-D-manno-heptose 1-phosphate adenylyltransferase [Dictyoglomus]|jgi:rfaE bifunctional protein nucleotidyltransferase chain/domain|uniref:D-glycero-beta-D-manno-heptose 1-phosphate adenylyltransferase n=1 Tax=Dictyoglomus turgidum (strain DSM 6724 / Z-1310) TaxID=515635 RepID=B8DZR7_DICTD|nr:MULTISPECIES: D-glycero-beta-D-manno-heptose 1-phosphate adenylyltransferase [Dictyoglomus]ACK42000.1 rfaE bifunctional protein [Dictyoglomus turgidum DSM 6724]PNV80913.1 MAG: D-glycero-beta-D-manno-heptose 1-phosphate adenylyltransferase [Dictyoglomus turgidum]HBU31440.1 D-glycero-beta-D-manno-heptose 1-phosphate adenylyltransferase [Dictyoglomus sp.]
MWSSERKIKTKEEICNIAERFREEGKTIVFTNGCFEILHPGHITLLEKAKSFGDILIVGINSDESVKKIKGEKKLIFDEKSRLKIISALECVDYTVLFNEETPENIISIIKPHIHVKGGDYKEEDLPEAKIVKSYGGKIIIVPLIEGFSTTQIINKILALYKDH